MGEPISAVSVVGTTKCQTSDNGENAVFGLKIDQGGTIEDVNFSIPFERLEPLISSLIAVYQLAEELRSKNPLHQGNLGHGFVLDLDKLTIGIMNQRPGWMVLDFLVRGKSSRMRYKIAADKTRLENLIAALDECLYDIDQNPGGQGMPQ